MGWGAKLVGYSQVVGALDSLKTVVSDDVVYIVGTNIEYAVYVELGTSSMDPQPYLRRAANEVERSISRIIDKTGAESTEDAVKVVALHVERLAAKFAPVDTGTLQASITSAPKSEYPSEVESARRKAIAENQ